MCQLRFVCGTRVAGVAQALRDHLAARGLAPVQVETTLVCDATRLDPDHPWACWARDSVECSLGTPPAVLTPFVGHWSDQLGRTRIMLIACVLLLLSFCPAFLLLNRGPGAATVIGVVVWLSILKFLYFGALPALMSELFPTATRATGLSLTYNVGVTLFGGFGPFVMTWLRTEFAVHAISDGRLCMAALNGANLDRVAAGLRAVATAA